jgi:hypothetical protein
MDTTHINMERRTVFNLALFAIGNSVCLLGCCCCSHLTPLGLIESGRTGERERDRERETEREREREKRRERERDRERERETLGEKAAGDRNALSISQWLGGIVAWTD